MIKQGMTAAAVLVLLASSACGGGDDAANTSGSQASGGGDAAAAGAGTECPTTYPTFNSETAKNYALFTSSTTTFAWGESITASQYYTETAPAVYSISQPQPFTPGPDASFVTTRGEPAGIDRPADECVYAMTVEITGPVDGENDGDTTRYDPDIFSVARDGQVAQIYVYDPDNGADSLQVDVPEGEAVSFTWAFVAPSADGDFEALGPSTNETESRVKVTN